MKPAFALLVLLTGCAHWDAPSPLPRRMALLSIYGPGNITPEFALRTPMPDDEPQPEMTRLLDEVASGEVPRLLAHKGFEPVLLDALTARPAFRDLVRPDSTREVASLARGTGKRHDQGWVSARGYPLLPIQFTRDPRSARSMKELCESLGVEGVVLLEVRLGYDDGWLRAAPDLVVRPVASTAIAVIEKGGETVYRSPTIGTGAPFVSGPAVVTLKDRRIQWDDTSRAAFRQVLLESLSRTFALMSEPD